MLDVDILFSDYLKDLREKVSLSQTEAMKMLSVSDPEFSNVDSVTFSRWERRITKPHRARQISVIRVFTNDLFEYLKKSYQELGWKEQSKLKFLEDKICERYCNPLLMSTVSYYNRNDNIGKEVVIEALSHSNLEVFKYNLDLFSNSLKSMYVDYGLDGIDILKFHNENRIIFRRAVIDGVTYGHTIKAFFNNDNIKKQIKNINNSEFKDRKCIDLNFALPLRTNESLACYMVSQCAITENVFRQQLYDECKFLAMNANIHFFYKKITLKTSFDMMIAMGFEIVSHGSEHPVGEIKIGKKKYSWAILYIPTNHLFSRPEFMHFLSV